MRSKFFPWLNFFIALFCCWQLFSTQSAIADESKIFTIPTSDRLEIIQDLENREILTPTEAKQQRKYYQQQPDRSTQKFLKRIQGIFTLSNIIWIFSSILLVISLGGLINLYLWSLLKSIPAIAYEIIAYLTTLTLLVGGYWLKPPLGEYLAFPSCLALIGLWSLSDYLHSRSLKKLYQALKTDGYYLGCLFMTLSWGAIAILYESTAIGFIAVIALEAYLGFLIVGLPGIYLLGFTKRSLLKRAVISSLILLTVYLTWRLSSLQLPYFAIFSPGVFFVGTFVYFLGLLIWSSKWYCQEKLEYRLLQPITILSGAIALFLGTMKMIPQLQGIGGTFFFLYVIEKYFELPWSKQTIIWATFGFSTLLFVSAWIMRQYPEYFLFLISNLELPSLLPFT